MTALAAVCTVYSQELKVPSLTDYYQQELYINPAVTGTQGNIASTLSLRKQWMQIEGSPAIQRLQVHSPFFKNKMGLGLTLEHETLGVSGNFSLGVNYAYHLTLAKGVLSLGMQTNLVTFQENLGEVSTFDATDPMFRSNTQLLAGFDLGIGAYYYTENFYAGISAPTLFDNSLKQSTDYKLVNSLSFQKAPIYITGGYVFKIKSFDKIKWHLKPHVLLGYSSFYKWVYNIGATSFFYDKVWVGMNVRYNNEIGASIGVRLMNLININYSFSTNYLNLPYAYRGFTHEIRMNVLFDNKIRLKFF